MFVLGCIQLIIAAVGVAAGIFLITVGIGHTYMPQQLQTIIEQAKIPQPHIVLVIIGILIVLIAISSLLKILRSSLIGKVIYCAVIGGLIVGLGTIAYLVFYDRDKFYADAIEVYDESWYERDKPGVSDFVNTINQELECCGQNSSADYLGEIPSSCCETPIDDVCPVKSIFKNGCHKALTDYIASKANLIGGAAIGIGILLIFLLLGAICC